MSAARPPTPAGGETPDPTGELTALLDRDPGLALPAIARYHASVADADDATIAAASYLLGRALAETGDVEAARGQVEEAARRWRAAGDHLRALRTNAGLMSLVTHAGDHEEAIALGASTLEQLPADGPEVADLRGVLEQNIGVALGHAGRFSTALEAYERAAAAYRAAGRTDRLPFLAVNRGAELLDIGRVDDAVATLHSAIGDAHELELVALAARGDGLLGWATALQGELDRAVTHLERAIASFRALAMDDDAETATLRLGEVLLMLGDWVRADETFSGLVAGGTSVSATTRAAATNGLVATAIGRDVPELAEQRLEHAKDTWRELGDHPGHAAMLVEQAGLRLAQGKDGDALAAALEALDVLGPDGDRRWPLHRLYVLLRLVDVLLPDGEAAAPYAREATALSERVGIPLLRCRAHRRLGSVHAALGETDAALHELAIAIDLGEDLRARLPRESQRLSFGDDVDHALEAASSILLDRGDLAAVARAADLADRRRDRVLSELLEAHILPDDPSTSSTAVTAISDALSVATSPARAAALRQHVDGLAASHPRRSAGHVRPGSPTKHRSSPLVLAYTVLGDEVAAFVTSGGRTRGVRRVAAVSRVHDLLDELDGELWYASIDAARRSDPLHPRVRATERILRALGASLLDPLAHLLPTGSAPAPLAVVPHGLLHDVPFRALLTGRGMLLEWAVPVTLPNLRFLDDPPEAAGGPARVLAVGVPSADAPGVIDELSIWAACGIPARTLVGADATIAALTRARVQANVLHVATHGLFDEDAPSDARIQLADGWLTARHLAQLDLRGMLVILSACDTARAAVRGPSGASLGMARAALAAGATAVVASSWPLDDRVAIDLLSDLASELAGGATPDEALRSAQLAQRNRTPHPACWAAMTIIGRPDHERRHHDHDPHVPSHAPRGPRPLRRRGRHGHRRDRGDGRRSRR